MSNFCRLKPTIFKRNGKKIEEVDSKLFQDIKEAVEDNELAWKMWAYTKTAEFKRDHKDVEFDELGEVTFPSLIKALGMEEVYNEQKSIKAIAKEYNFLDNTFPPGTAVDRATNFNVKEKKFVAHTEKTEKGYEVKVEKRTPEHLEPARQQTYNHTLTKEIVGLLRTLGFDIAWTANPRYAGMFDPENATLHDGLVTIIKIAKGERGEEALPEEFAHLIIEGLTGHPLVQRLLSTITDEDVREVLGEDYDRYMNEYDSSSEMMKKEAAGKMLAEYITQKGTISNRETVNSRRSLLGRIWDWVKNLFLKVSDKDLQRARNTAYDITADIYDLISSGDIVPIIDKQSILRSKPLFRVTPKYEEHLKYNTAEKIARGAEYTLVRKRAMQYRHGEQGDAVDTGKVIQEVQGLNEEGSFYSTISKFLSDTTSTLTALYEDISKYQKYEEEGKMTEMHVINSVAKFARRIDEVTSGYSDIVGAIASFDPDVMNVLDADNTLDVSASKALQVQASGCLEKMNSLMEWRKNTTRNILYRAFIANGFRDNIAKGITDRSTKEKILSLAHVLEQADRDINVIDRWLSAMSDADDVFLVLMDSIVKNQQGARDIELEEYRKQIALLDKRLRDAGFTSDFIYERDEDGVPTGRIISEYDWITYNNERKAKREELLALNLSRADYSRHMEDWKREKNAKGEPRTITIFLDPEEDAKYKAGKQVSPDAVYEIVPNPKFYTKNKDVIENLAPAQKEYYRKMMDWKRKMMKKVPHRGQHLYQCIYISKDFVEGVLDGSSGSIYRATLEYYKKKYTRRPDDLGFGTSDNFPDEIRDILKNESDSSKAAEKIIEHLMAVLDEDISTHIKKSALTKTIGDSRKYEENIEQTLTKVLELIDSANFYIVNTDFAGHTIQKLPMYYTRPLKNMKNLSTDFSGSMVSYGAMCINYEKMNEVVDILEVARDYTKERNVAQNAGNYPIISRVKAFGKAYRGFVERAGSGYNITGRVDDFMDAVVYEEYKKDEGSVEVLGINFDMAKTLDAIKDYTGILGLGFNIFSAISNVAVGKLQQWIEAWAGEYFEPKDYFKACAQYAEHLVGHLAEINSPIKKNKLSLLIAMFDPMGEYYSNTRRTDMNADAIKRIFGNGVLAYLGMNAGEHMLHCQTMLAMLNHIQLIDPSDNNKRISLYDALEVKEGKDGITRLELKKGLVYERNIIDHNGTDKTNPNYGKPLMKDGKMVVERVSLDDEKNFQKYIIKQKRRIRKVNDSLNGAFSMPDRGALHRRAIGRLILQFRQWMPAHYMRRFASAHYDDDLEQWREGYYTTVYKILRDVSKDLAKGKFELVKVYDNLSETQKFNLKRAEAEIAMFFMLLVLVRLGGKVSDRDRSWLDKMVLYQIHRMFLEVGASAPIPGSGFFGNIITIMQSPAASISFFEKCNQVMQLYNIFDEVQSGRYQGWSEWGRDFLKITPIEQILKGYVFDDSMFAMYEKD